MNNANVSLLECGNFVAYVPTVQDRIDYIYSYYNFDDDYDENIPNSEFKDNVSHYIAGYVVKKLSPKLECFFCVASLRTEKEAGLISTFDTGNFMIYPSQFVKKIAEISERILSVENNRDWLVKKYYFDYIVIKASNSFVSTHGHLFKVLDNHGYNLMKYIMECYISIRLKSHARQKNVEIKRNRIRSKMSKLILFNHQ